MTRWPITAEDRKIAVESLVKIITSSQSYSAIIEAAEVLIEMERQNMEYEKRRAT